jgi:hypothetical protein
MLRASQQERKGVSSRMGPGLAAVGGADVVAAGVEVVVGSASDQYQTIYA